MFESLFADVPREFIPAMLHVLWRVDYTDPLAAGYSVLNLLEAAAWFGVAVWVLRRHRRKPGGPWNYAYALLFAVFGASDVWESQQVPMWLIAAKGLIFTGIVAARWVVVTRYYPGAKM